MSHFGKINLFFIFFIYLIGCDQNLTLTKNFTISEFIINIFDNDIRNEYKLIAHAGGGINNQKYTNSLEAINKSIKLGYKLIEIDLIETSDNKLVGAHDWDHFKMISNCCKNNEIPKLADFKNYKINLNLNTVDYKIINEIFLKNEDLILVTDKTNNFDLINKSFSFDKKRIIVEIFGRENYFKAIKNNIKNPMYSANINEINFIKKYNVQLIAIHSKDFILNKKTYKELSDNGTIIFVYSTNDTNFVEENSDTIRSFYSDFINIKKNVCVSEKCETY
jgi:glycerophosphoryl diester phosphodiesterase